MSFTAKSVIFDFADNYGNQYCMTMRAIDFWSAGAKITNLSADFTAYATTEFSSTFAKEFAFDTSLSKVGGSANTSWNSTDALTNQRMICVFDSPITFDEIRVNNAHDAGSYTDEGVKNVKIHYSSDTITDTTYNASISNSTQIFDGVFDQHSAADVEEEQIIPLSLPTYNVTYDGNGSDGGSVPTDSTDYEEGTSVSVLGNTGSLTLYGYAFDGWNTASDGSGTTYAGGSTFTMGGSSVTLYAVWTALPTYNVTYDGNGSDGGSVPTDSVDYLDGEAATVLGNTGGLTLSGKTFLGWNTQTDGAGVTYNAADTLNIGVSNVTLYAIWAPVLRNLQVQDSESGSHVPVAGLEGWDVDFVQTQTLTFAPSEFSAEESFTTAGHTSLYWARRLFKGLIHAAFSDSGANSVVRVLRYDKNGVETVSDEITLTAGTRQDGDNHYLAPVYEFELNGANKIVIEIISISIGTVYIRQAGV